MVHTQNSSQTSIPSSKVGFLTLSVLCVYITLPQSACSPDFSFSPSCRALYLHGILRKLHEHFGQIRFELVLYSSENELIHINNSVTG